LRRFSLQSQIQRLLDDSDSGTPPKSKKGATGIFKEREFSRMSFNPKMHNPPKRESISDTLDVHEEGKSLK
jgi:hypothetical protein